MPALEQLADLFNEAHRKMYGYANDGDAVEVVNMRIALRGAHRSEPLPVLGAQGDDSCAAEAHAVRDICFDDTGVTETPIYWRDSLHAGQSIHGPAVIEQLDATTVLFPGDVARVNDAASLIITVPRV